MTTYSRTQRTYRKPRRRVDPYALLGAGLTLLLAAFGVLTWVAVA